MSSASHNNNYTNANGNSNINFQCAAGAFCKIPSVDFSTSPHKCPYCQRLLHGVCGILHDPDSITYHNHCNFCDTKFSNSQNQLPPHQAVIPSRIPAPQNCEFPTIQVATSSIRTPTPTSQLLFYGTPITNNQLLTCTSTPTCKVLNSALSRGLTSFKAMVIHNQMITMMIFCLNQILRTAWFLVGFTLTSLRFTITWILPQKRAKMINAFGRSLQ